MKTITLILATLLSFSSFAAAEVSATTNDAVVYIYVKSYKIAECEEKMQQIKVRLDNKGILIIDKESCLTPSSSEFKSRGKFIILRD